MLGRAHLQEADVVEQVPADDLGSHAVAVRELDVDLGCRLHCIGYDVPAPAVVITWEFVRMYPSGETTNPDPWPSVSTSVPP